MTDLRRGLSYLRAEPAGRGYYSYESDEEGRPIRYTLHSDDWRDLGARLRRAEAATDRGGYPSPDDCYSRWCADSLPERSAVSR